MSFIDLNDTIIAQVREAADIVDVISQVTPLKAAGRSHKGLCPFHREKTPSFNVDRSRGFFHCFGCGVGGDVFKFVMLTERFTFPEAVEYVANRVGMTLPRRSTTKTRDTDKEELLELLEEASSAFHQSLGWTPNTAQAYLDKRGVSAEVRSKYGLGYAPDSWDYLLTRLGRKYSTEKLEKAGLILPRKGGSGFYDRFRNRLIIPIHSEAGTVIGFGGRTLDGSDPKYLNSPESPVFNKSQLLYNLHRSKQNIRRLDRAILVEGYFDCISLDDAGVPGVVASMGTSLTPGQASLVARYTRRIVVCYDGDDAGRNATLKAAPVLLASGLHVEVFNVGRGHDPDTFIREFGVDRYIEEISNSKPLIDFALETWAPDPSTMSSAAKEEKLAALAPILASMSGVSRNDAAQKTADWLRLRFETVWDRVKGPSTAVATPSRLAGGNSSRNTSGEKHLLAALVQDSVPAALAARIREEFFGDPRCRAVFHEWAALREAGEIDFNELGTRLRGEDENALLAEVVHWPEIIPDQLEQIVAPMERAWIEARLDDLQRRIQAGEEPIEPLFSEKMELTKRFRDIVRR
ncbi:MAG: DNA primase [Thermoanaerobaculia bacterium]|nr:DNA primase [Thermoanaerobaculia bacterium]